MHAEAQRHLAREQAVLGGIGDQRHDVLPDI
jgi:hypothetical protein